MPKSKPTFQRLHKRQKSPFPNPKSPSPHPKEGHETNKQYTLARRTNSRAVSSNSEMRRGRTLKGPGTSMLQVLEARIHPMTGSDSKQNNPKIDKTALPPSCDPAKGESFGLQGRKPGSDFCAESDNTKQHLRADLLVSKSIREEKNWRNADPISLFPCLYRSSSSNGATRW